jgi:DNA-binding transcriptional LysR family regulator
MLSALLCVVFLHPTEDLVTVLQPLTVKVTRVEPRLSRERIDTLLAFSSEAPSSKIEQQIARLALSWLGERTPCFCDDDREPASLAIELFAMLRHQRFSSPRAHLWALFQGWATWKHGVVHRNEHEVIARALSEGVQQTGLAMAMGAEQPPELEWAALEAIAQWEAVSP